MQGRTTSPLEIKLTSNYEKDCYPHKRSFSPYLMPGAVCLEGLQRQTEQEYYMWNALIATYC